MPGGSRTWNGAAESVLVRQHSIVGTVASGNSASRISFLEIEDMVITDQRNCDEAFEKRTDERKFVME